MNDGSKTRIDPRNGREEVLDLIIGNTASTSMKPEFFVGDDVGSDHLPLHCELTFGNPQPNNPIFYRNVSQMDCTRFKELINDKVSSLPANFETAGELDRIANDLPNVVREAFEASCPLREKKTRTGTVSAQVLALIKRKRKLRREKSAAMARGDSVTAQTIQRESNLIGSQIKKQQKLEQKVRHEVACSKLASESDPRKFFQSVKRLSCNEEGTTVHTKKVSDDEGT